MPGHPIDMVNFKDNDAFNRYRCPECNLLLKEAVQLSCGHRLCRSCAEARTAEYSPQLCPVADCKEPIDAEDGLYVSYWQVA